MAADVWALQPLHDGTIAASHCLLCSHPPSSWAKKSESESLPSTIKSLLLLLLRACTLVSLNAAAEAE